MFCRRPSCHPQRSTEIAELIPKLTRSLGGAPATLGRGDALTPFPDRDDRFHGLTECPTPYRVSPETVRGLNRCLSG